MITRRKVFLALGVLAALPAFAQQEKRVRRIGYFSGGSVQSSAALLAAFREGMAALRWVEGRDYVMDARYANGVVQALPGLADELIATRPDLLLTIDAAARLLAQKTKTIPIVFAIAQDPVGSGLAASLRRPGGNATGLTSLERDLDGKRLQLLKEAFPRVVHVVLLFEPTDGASRSQVKGTEEAATRLGMRISPVELRQAADMEPAFNRGTALGAHAYVIAQGALTSGVQRQVIADRILRAKVPAIFETSVNVEAGGLMSYGPSWQDNFRRTAGYVDKILKGAKPGDLPIEQPTKFELVVNLKTAKAMGIRFPQSFLVRADRVIE